MDLFLIRHGESRWNKAQRDLALHKMADFDHPLNATGVKQAQDFNRAWTIARDAALSGQPLAQEGDAATLHRFLAADLAMASPLTRMKKVESGRGISSTLRSIRAST